MGKGAKANHLAYLGDATIGSATNVGAGTITCNYDGEKKHQTVIGNNVFVGSNSTLVAPVKLADGAYIAAGSAVTQDVPAGALGIGRARQENKEGWREKRRQKAKRYQTMCGIIGYIGPKPVVPVILDGLRRLEYRGYDSAGIAVVHDGQIDIRRSAGKLDQPRELHPGQAAGGRVRPRPHPLGDPRPADRRERASAPRWLRPHCRRPQRHHRELPRDQARADRRGPQVRVGDRHRSRRAPGPEGMAGRWPRECGAAGHEARARAVRPGAVVGRRSQEAGDGSERSAHRGGHRRWRVFRRLGRAGNPEPHARCRLHGRPRDGRADVRRASCSRRSTAPSSSASPPA